MFKKTKKEKSDYETQCLLLWNTNVIIEQKNCFFTTINFIENNFQNRISSRILKFANQKSSYFKTSTKNINTKISIFSSPIRAGLLWLCPSVSPRSWAAAGTEWPPVTSWRFDESAENPRRTSGRSWSCSRRSTEPKDAAEFHESP